ncbi:MAG: methyltransferase, TIGR04325 family [Cyclobacteriaceae bacterium]|nr:methyltransferase, TIGR04325 family [Cyclobacteriaceae bacterium]
MTKSDFIPPIITRFISGLNLFKSYGWFGNFSAWAEAMKQAEGYDGGAIFEKVKSATLKVKNNEAVYERDSILFDEIEYSWPLLAALMWVAARKDGKLSVLDFGGSLGSTYYQNRAFYDGLKEVRWSIVEQEHFVEAGNSQFKSDQLRFYKTIQECMKIENSAVVLFSCVLQYLERPYDTIKEAFQGNAEYIVIDSMPFNTSEKDRLTIQKVNPLIYKASYPCWLLNRSEFLQFFKGQYSLVAEFKSHLYIKVDGETIPYEGFIFKKS